MTGEEKHRHVAVRKHIKTAEHVLQAIETHLRPLRPEGFQVQTAHDKLQKGQVINGLDVVPAEGRIVRVNAIGFNGYKAVSYLVAANETQCCLMRKEFYGPGGHGGFAAGLTSGIFGRETGRVDGEWKEVLWFDTDDEETLGATRADVGAWLGIAVSKLAEEL